MCMDLQKVFTYPYDNETLLHKQKKIRRMLLERNEICYVKKRIAVLGGSTTSYIKDFLELFLLQAGIQPEFYESEYNKYYEDAVFGNAELDAFCPEIVIVFTSVVNLQNSPVLGEGMEAISEKVNREFLRFRTVWESIAERYHAIVVQNNFDFSCEEPLGSLGATVSYGMSRYVEMFNARFADYAANHEGFYLHDLHGLSARIGLVKWHNRFQYFAYKFAMDYDVMPQVANSLAKIVRAILGKSRKCLILDLDNTLWGGTIGDDGMENIVLGHDTPEGEAYLAFQEYVLGLKERGILLAICSKNEESIAKSGFSHPDSALHLSDFVSFHANWEPKDVNIRAIAKEINIGTDSMVFIDDNPAERQIVRDTMPEIDPKDVFSYICAIEGAGYFEPITISKDDQNRNQAYRENQQRCELENRMKNYDDFLRSLEMKAEIAPFKEVYFDRIAQLANKTNQFNLTTQRYTRSEIEQFAGDKRYVTLYGRLKDKFGDNGLVSVIVGEIAGEELHIRLWLMSCRVLKRGLEQNMMDVLVQKAVEAGCRKLIGYYFRTPKNQMVMNLYGDLGFSLIRRSEKDSIWELPMDGYQSQGRFIALEGVNE
ncbi:MAG: HAD family hydrolase [Selenomonadaceae bacterium]|nr:HAD family hydrolase [Selenomonadaceae bacterium]